jgi:hypothetical protein
MLGDDCEDFGVYWCDDENVRVWCEAVGAAYECLYWLLLLSAVAQVPIHESCLTSERKCPVTSGLSS